MTDKQRKRRIYECSFCGKNRDQVKHLIAGPGGVYVCGECVDEFTRPSTREPAEQTAAVQTRETGPESRCSFCGKQQRQAQYLILGSDQVNICNQCLDLCHEIMNEEKHSKKQ